MARALDELAVIGVATNQGFHRRLMADDAFRRGEIDIQFLERRADLLRPAAASDAMLEVAIAAALAEDEARQHHRTVVSDADRTPSAWASAARRETLR
jgi:acetyl/propionyl-CoA carboxylase alpha subunit